MKHINKIGKGLQYLLRVVIFSCFFLILSNVSEATHYRYGSMSWEKVSGNTYIITISQAWRKTYFPGVVQGGTVNTGTLNLGDGTATPVLLEVTSLIPTDDWFYGQFVYTKTYPSTPTIRDYNVTFTGCCRISTLINAADGEYLSSTKINVGTSNNSPIAITDPVKSAQVNTITTFPVGFFEPDGDVLTFRLATATEMGALNYLLPVGTSINSTTGVVTFNGVGKALNSKYALGVVVSDGKTTVMADFIVNMVAQSAPPQFDYAFTPVNAHVFQIASGQNLSFGIKAFDTDPGSTVFLTAVGLPIGSAFPFVAPSNPVATTFSWTPTATQFGTYVISFTATDNINVQTPTFITIVVSLKPVFDVPPTPAYAIELGTQPGTPFQFTVQASDPDPLDIVSLTAFLNKPVTAVLTPLPSVAANPTTANFTWNPVVSDWGEREIQFEATNSHGDQAYHKISLIVNTPPVFTSAPSTTSVIVNQTYSYAISGLDPDIPYGDKVELLGTSIPTWLTFVDNGNGTGSLIGTPSTTDAGTYTMTLYLEDIYHHHSGSHGVPSQVVTITVIPCTIKLDSKTVSNVTCSGFANGKAQVLFTGCFGPFKFNWSNGSKDSTLRNVAPGTYSVLITDAYNCSVSDTVIITEPSPLAITSSHSNYKGFGVACKGGLNGTATVAAAGGVPGYNFVWSTGSTDASITGLAAGNYIVTATDANACSISNTIIITEPTPLALTSSHSDFNGFGVSCKGGSNGNAKVTAAAGGVSGYNFVWSTGSTDASITGLAAGNYIVTATDANACSISNTIIITEPTPLVLTSRHSDFNGFGVSCKGSANGTAAVFAAGGVPSYSVVWSTGSTSNAVTGLVAGNYIATATDANACSISNTIVITEPSPLTLTSSHSDFNGFGVSCEGSANGTAAVVAAGGVPSYSVVWSTGSTSNAVTGLVAGNYIATATDTNACSTSVTVVITEPTRIINTITNLSNYTGFNVSCFGGTNGSATSTVTGGVIPYIYLWSNGTTTKVVSGLSATTYSVVSTDKNGCLATVSVVLTAPTAIVATVTSPTVIGSYNTSCSLDGDGMATVVGIGGVLPYTTSWNTGATTASITGLLAGAYSVTLTDKNGCATTSSISLTKPVNCNCITVPIAPTASCANCTKVLDGMSNATINAGENACIVNSFTGNINMNGGNLVICGNANLQWLNIPNNSKVTILGTVTLSGINFNGANAILENYGTLVINYGLNVAGKLTNNKTITVKQGANFNAGSYVVNNGTFNVASDLNNNAYFANNGLLIVGNTMYNNSNSTMLNNCTTKAKAYFVNSNVVFANNGTLDVINDTRFNSAIGTVASGSILRTKDVYLNGTTLSGATTSCALITASNYSQINQASLNGKIALCDANGFEIKNNLTLLSGAIISCTTCSYTGVPVASNLRDAAEEDLTLVQTENGLTMYPNPVSKGMEVTISSSIEIESANVFDNMGRIVLTTSGPVFNVTNLSAGIYLVKIQDVLGNMTTTKLVVR